ncbi:magnesium transporter CorA family protein [Enterococcus rivorum]|nr:magnesium transporter CorA family protein [Enterococcus rivorum]
MTAKKKLTSLEEIIDQQAIYFVIGEYKERENLQKKFHFHDYQEQKETLDQMIHFQIYENFDFVSLLYLDLQDEEFTHSKLNLYLGEQALVVLTDDVQGMEKTLNKEIKECLDDIFIGREKINHLYYHIFHSVLHEMFIKLEDFEAILLAKEDALMKKVQKDEFPTLIALKRTANEIKRNMRLLAYVSDEILANDGGSLLESDINLFKSINIRTKKMYEFSVSLLETSMHLLTVYDSKIAEQTNAFMNTFTVITMFLTPLTFISSLYAMNFIGTPILKFDFGIILFLVACFLVLSLTTFILRRNKWI